MGSGPRRIAIAIFCLLYIGTQIGLIVRGQLANDKRFGFQMFAEATYFQSKLIRRLHDGTEVAVPSGVWYVDGPSGRVSYKWSHFVRDYKLGALGTRMRAKRSMAITLYFAQHAVNWVAARIPEDHETSQLILEINYRTAGGKVVTTRVESFVREPPEPTP